MPQRKLVPHVVNRQEIATLAPHSLVCLAVKQMIDRNISAVVITEDGTTDGRLLGVFTERDALVRIVGAGRSARKTRLSEVMTRAPETLPPEARVIDALTFMRKRHYRHLPVVDDERVVGMVSIRTLFAVVTEQLEDEVHECEAFVFGSAYSVDKVQQRRLPH
ncbi:MAG: CBS domain-containing protein [Rhodospirillaceae bacterium]